VTSSRSTALALTLAVALGVSALARADQPSADDRTDPDVMITVTIARGEGGEMTSRTFQTIARPGRSSQARLGSRVPIPVSTTPGAGEADSGGGQRSAYSYQDIGFSGDFKASVAADGAILVRGSVEDSAVAAPGGGGSEHRPPTVSALFQRFEVLLRDGVPQKIFTGEQPPLGKVTIEISATALR
jgi:hypothetical protein